LRQNFKENFILKFSHTFSLLLGSILDAQQTMLVKPINLPVNDCMAVFK